MINLFDKGGIPTLTIRFSALFYVTPYFLRKIILSFDITFFPYIAHTRNTFIINKHQQNILLVNMKTFLFLLFVIKINSIYFQNGHGHVRNKRQYH